ncbi:MAG: CRISPR-associated helicase/endonuclease Cas3, partial [Acidobacteriota bacterium]
IAQAAGRCNRNGNLASGKTVIFQSEHTSSEVFLRDTAQIAREVLPLHGDPLSLETVEHYFRLYYWDQSDRWDARNVLDEFRLQQDRELPFLFGFARTASRFRLIEDSGRPILIPWGEEGARLCEELRDAWVGPPLALRRKLQRYTVQVPLRTWQRNQGRAFEMVHDQYPVLIEPKLHYSKYTGLVLESDVTDALMV